MKDFTLLCQSILHRDWIDPILHIFHSETQVLGNHFPGCAVFAMEDTVKRKIEGGLPLLPLTASPGVTILSFPRWSTGQRKLQGHSQNQWPYDYTSSPGRDAKGWEGVVRNM